MTVLDIAGDEGSPGDDAADVGRGEGKDSAGRFGPVEL